MEEKVKEKKKIVIPKNGKKVLMLCTGGTIGMLHKIPEDTTSPLVPAKWSEIENNFIAMKDLPFDVVAEEMDDLIDSSDMHPGYWQDIAKKIENNYSEYNGFVILHGTDTMAYTATALSFFFENLGKPVIITGSQLPLAKPRSDAAQNLVTSLIIAASEGVPVIPEVCVFFDKKLLRGNRCRKVSSNGYDGFDSPNFPPLATIGEHIKVNEKLIRKIPTEGFFINPSIEANVMLCDIFPGIKPDMLRNIFNVAKLRGIVLRTYGTGNTSSDKNFLAEILYATKDKKLTLVNITQCNQGMVEMGIYAAGAQLISRGVVSGGDMTPEAALVKMQFLLGQGYDNELIKQQIQRDLRGEQSANTFNFIYDRRLSANEENEEHTPHVCKLEPKTVTAGIERGKINSASLRFEGVTIDTPKDETKDISLAVYINYPAVTKDSPTNIPQCLGVIKNINEKTDFVLPQEQCTQSVNQVINPALPLQLTVVSQNADITWEGIVLSMHTEVD